MSINQDKYLPPFIRLYGDPYVAPQLLWNIHSLQNLVVQSRVYMIASCVWNNIVTDISIAN